MTPNQAAKLAVMLQQVFQVNLTIIEPKPGEGKELVEEIKRLGGKGNYKQKRVK